MTTPCVKDNDRDEITVTLDGKELRGWSYENEAERRVKMLLAREFVEGWFQGSEANAYRVLNAAGDYMTKQYGNSALHHPLDRTRILAALSQASE